MRMTKENIAGILQTEQFRPYIEAFNRQDEELFPQHIPNAGAWEFLKDNIPFFECPDKELELTYYFRWWTYRKHIKKTPEGFVITEFLPPVGWAGKYNTVNFTACQHYMEGRWLADQSYLDAYAHFWFRQGGTLNGPRAYTCWHAYALRQRAKATGDSSALDAYLDDMVANYTAWEKGWDWREYWVEGCPTYHTGKHDNGMFFQGDGYDAGECSIGGHGFRPMINSVMFGEAGAIAAIALHCGRDTLAAEYEAKAASLKRLVESRLWNEEDQFFEVMGADEKLVEVRELNGYVPWYFHLPDPGREVAWKQLTDPSGFAAPYGPTFAEQRHPQFVLSYTGHECQWNGPSWPLSTSLALTALANTLNDYPPQVAVGKRAFHDTLMAYARSHRRIREDGSIVPWIDENLNPYTGDWIARTRLKSWENGTWSADKGGPERGKDYNHSTFCDLIITGIAGLRPREDDTVEVNPLVPAGTWDYFCLDRVPYHGRKLTILWDRTGNKYGRGEGLQVLVDGRPAGHSQHLERIQCPMS